MGLGIIKAAYYVPFNHRLLPYPPVAGGEGIVTVGVTLCLCVCQAATAHQITLGGEVNALYPVLSSFIILASDNV